MKKGEMTVRERVDTWIFRFLCLPVFAGSLVSWHNIFEMTKMKMLPGWAALFSGVVEYMGVALMAVVMLLAERTKGRKLLGLSTFIIGWILVIAISAFIMQTNIVQCYVFFRETVPANWVGFEMFPGWLNVPLWLASCWGIIIFISTIGFAKLSASQFVKVLRRWENAEQALKRKAREVTVLEPVVEKIGGGVGEEDKSDSDEVTDETQFPR